MTEESMNIKITRMDRVIENSNAYIDMESVKKADKLFGNWERMNVLRAIHNNPNLNMDQLAELLTYKKFGKDVNIPYMKNIYDIIKLLRMAGYIRYDNFELSIDGKLEAMRLLNKFEIPSTVLEVK